MAKKNKVFALACLGICALATLFIESKMQESDIREIVKEELKIQNKEKETV